MSYSRNFRKEQLLQNTSDVVHTVAMTIISRAFSCPVSGFAAITHDSSVRSSYHRWKFIHISYMVVRELSVSGPGANVPKEAVFFFSLWLRSRLKPISPSYSNTPWWYNPTNVSVGLMLILAKMIQQNSTLLILALIILPIVSHLFLTGYGFITPQTPEGQLLCIFVSLLGIPITMLAFKSIGEIIAKWISNVVEKFETKIFKRTRPKRMQAKSTVFLVSLMVLIIMVNGSLMMRVFSWSLMEGVYFWFITLTTIGFGDYVPAKSQRIMKLSISISHDNEEKSAAGATEKITIIFTGIFYTFYVVLCLCFVSSVLNSVVATMEESKCRTLCSGCVPRKTHDNQHNDQNNTSEQCDMTYLGMENFGFTRRENSTPLPTKGLKTIPSSTPANLESQQAKDFWILKRIESLFSTLWFS